jgi:diguanylate cyclase (GGDEF)-like protein/PAS domain S-box-containing protein
MVNDKKTINAVADLRRKAEGKVASLSAYDSSSIELDAKHLLHKLQVHQAELGMQNEELHRTIAEKSTHEAHLRNIIANTPAGYFHIDLEGRFLDVNTAWLRMHGYDSKDEVIGRPFSMMQVDSSSDSALAHLAELKKGVPIPYGEFESRRKDGSIGHHIFSAHPVVHVGTIVGFEWFIIDISERKAAQKKLLNKQQELENLNHLLEKKVEERTIDLRCQLNFTQTILDAIPIPVFYKDREGHYLGCNKAYEEFRGITIEDLIGKCVFDIAAPDEAKAQHAMDMKLLSDCGSQQYTASLSLKDGSRREVIYHKACFKNMLEPAGLIYAIQDITALKEAEAELRIAANAFESLAGMVVTDAYGTILRVNRAFSEISGYSEEEVIGSNPRILKSSRHNADFYLDMWQSIKHNGGWQGEIWDRRKNGEEYPKWLTISAVKGSNGAITNYVGAHFDISERKQAEERINQLAYFDQLTGLPNRTLLFDRLKQAMTASGRSGNYGALLFIDLDNFKTLNDTHGHDMGDILLQQVAQRLTACVRAEDTVARLGGDEFVVMMVSLNVEEKTAATQTEILGEKILEALNHPYHIREITHHCTPSIGVNLFKGHQAELETVIKQADIAMYKSKDAGRNTIRFFNPVMEALVMERASLEKDLRQAILKRQFVLHYQPQVAGGKLIGSEALLRWQHPQRGMVSPASFIPLAEETHLILALGHWVLETACKQLVFWAATPEMSHLTVAVNVSALQFHDPGFVDQVLAVLNKTGANPHKLKLELTESMLVTNIDEIIEKMYALKSKGVGFSLDDFGTGYSSLAYLKRMPLDQLKIDQSFVRDVLIDPNDAIIAKTVIALANSLGFDVIAEGVETVEQRDFLAHSGCHAFQGYYFSRPLPLESFDAFAIMAITDESDLLR